MMNGLVEYLKGSVATLDDLYAAVGYGGIYNRSGKFQRLHGELNREEKEKGKCK